MNSYAFYYFVSLFLAFFLYIFSCLYNPYFWSRKFDGLLWLVSSLSSRQARFSVTKPHGGKDQVEGKRRRQALSLQLQCFADMEAEIWRRQSQVHDPPLVTAWVMPLRTGQSWFVFIAVVLSHLGGIRVAPIPPLFKIEVGSDFLSGAAWQQFTHPEKAVCVLHWAPLFFYLN